MYLITTQTNGEEIIINEVSTHTSNRIIGTLSQGINTIDTLEFTIYPNNIGYNKILPYKTTIQVFNTKTNEYEFRGRVISQVDTMGNDGVVSKDFICENELGYLCDSVQLYGEYHDITVASFLDLLINQHNELTENEKHFSVGIVEQLDNNDSLYRFLSYDTTWNNIRSDLLDKLGGELQIRHSGGTRYLDYLVQIGKKSETEILLGKNMQSLSEKKDPIEYCTRLLPLGAKLKTVGDDGNEVETETRMTIDDVNNESIYIEDEEAIAKFGIKTGVQIWEDVTNPENLLRKGQEYLANQKVVISDSINAVDLSLIGMDIDTFKVGDFYTIKNPLLNIERTVRIITKKIQIDSPEQTNITLGDEQESLARHNLSQKKQIISEIENVIKKQSSFEQTVDGFKTEVSKELEGQYEYISKVEQDAEAIRTEVSKKVGEDEIISCINQTAEEIKIQADKISLEGTVTANENFIINEDGSIEAKNCTIDGNISSTKTINAQGGIYTKQDIRGYDPTGISGGLTLVTSTGNLAVRTENEAYSVYLQSASGEVKVTNPVDPDTFQDLRAYNLIANNQVYANGAVLTSDREKKKNIEDYTESALDEICTTPIRQYHLNEDLDEEIKRIGLILQEAPLNAIDLRGKGIDLYQMATMAWKAIQELNNKIEDLKKGDING